MNQEKWKEQAHFYYSHLQNFCMEMFNFQAEQPVLLITTVIAIFCAPVCK